jgi:hypothetical protein
MRSFEDFVFKNGFGNFMLNPETEAGTETGCEKWGVMTTINAPPSEAVRRFLYKLDWCIVVVADLTKPKVTKTSYAFCWNEDMPLNAPSILYLV